MLIWMTNKLKAQRNLNGGTLKTAVLQAALNSTNLPDLVIAVTGKGPQKAFYEEKMQQLGLQHVAFRTLWLEASDYPLLLGSADLGICLHTSSSGLDLPMKVMLLLKLKIRCLHEAMCIVFTITALTNSVPLPT